MNFKVVVLELQTNLFVMVAGITLSLSLTKGIGTIVLSMKTLQDNLSATII